ncbi:MAG: CHAD domain-containing protein [Methanolobus sp.]|uniref:CHAD domain-containing protein n=1 Tax=Methanolobus sp. TaxID=1874737 RepID=UPI00272EFB65|nr:CHAD domain-containing protein [Methanolobus sp.]MDP2216673.1 CHAD domain-containing protein [Methanolobus sp.]
MNSGTIAHIPLVEEESSVVAVSPSHSIISMKKTNIKPSDTMREASCKILKFHFGRMLEHERGTQVGKDIEELHDMRVAAMRMRSVFQVLEEYMDMKKLDKHLKNLWSARRTLGQVRDMDVFLEKIDHYLGTQPAGSNIDLGNLTDSLHIEKAKRRGMMLIYMDSARYAKFISSLARILLDNGSWNMGTVTKKGDPGPCLVKDVLPVLLYSQLAKVRSYDTIVSAGSAPTFDQYHQRRIDVKILRYTLEFFREVLGQDSKQLIHDLKNLQDNLGDMHDAVVALELLDNFES